MQLLFYVLYILLLALGDQLVKYLVVAFIPLYGEVPFIPGVLRLTHVRNTGAAFSALEGQQWLFALVFVLFTLVLLWDFRSHHMGFKPFERWCIVTVYGGGLGNMVDRIRLGYVVDMFETTFIDFPVFNLADCFITCGCIALIGYILLFHRDIWKDEKKCA